MKVVWSWTAWREYLDWQSEDLTTVGKINGFIGEIRRDPVGKGTGQTERLRGVLAGFSSRRITQAHRFVYRVSGSGDDQVIEIIRCRGHY